LSIDALGMKVRVITAGLLFGVGMKLAVLMSFGLEETHFGLESIILRDFILGFFLGYSSEDELICSNPGFHLYSLRGL
jgi:hypothetical protein